MTVSEDRLDRVLASADPIEARTLRDDRVVAALTHMLPPITTSEKAGLDLLAFFLRRCTTIEEASGYLAETSLIARGMRSGMQPPLGGARACLLGVARNLMRTTPEHAPRLEPAAARLAAALSVATSASQPWSPTRSDDRVSEALGSLSRLDREIITLSVWDGLEAGEVASVLGLAPNVVRVRALRARARLRRELDRLPELLPGPHQ